MKLKNHYFLLRHGETIYQTKKKDFIYPSWSDNPPIGLIEKSKRNLRKLAKKIKKEKIDLIYSSDLSRTRQTAGIVAKEVGIVGIRVRLDKRLRDVNHGIYNGRTKKEFYRDFPYVEKRFSKGPQGGESWNDIKKRLLSFIKEIDKKYKNKRILIVGHGDPLWLLEGMTKGMTNHGLLDEIFVKKNFIQPAEFRKI